MLSGVIGPSFFFGGGAAASVVIYIEDVMSNAWRHFPENHNPDINQHKNFEFYVACTVLF
jgi:hypothetical protein